MNKVNISRKIKLDFYTENPHTHLIPTSQSFENHKTLVEQVAIGIDRNIPVLLIGETGTGKTSLIRYLANKTNNSFRRVNHNGGTAVEDIIGKILVNEKGTYWVDGVLVEAMRKGYWYLADEINATNAEINFLYHSLLDDDGFIVIPENHGEIVKPHPSFRFFASMNPSAEYAGTKELNKALMSRFMVLKADFPPPATEVKILTNRTGIDKERASKLVQFAGELRASYAMEKLNYVLSTRDLILWGDMFQIFKKYIPSAEISVLNKVDKEDFTMVKDLLNLHFKTIDDPKSKPFVPKEKDNSMGFKVGDMVIITTIDWVGKILSIDKDGNANIDNDGNGRKHHTAEVKDLKKT